MIRQPINILDVVDDFGRSFRRFHDNVVFNATEKLTTLLTFSLNSYLAQCDFEQALIAYYTEKSQWMLFGTFEAMQSFDIATDKLEKTATYAPIDTDRVQQLFGNHQEFNSFCKICNAAPYILVHIEIRKRNDDVSIVGIKSEQVPSQIEKLLLNRLRLAENDDEDCVEASESETSVPDGNAVLGKRSAQQRAETDTKRAKKSAANAAIFDAPSTVSAEEMAALDQKLFGSRFTVYASDCQFSKLLNTNPSTDPVDEALFSGTLDAAGDGTLPPSTSSVRARVRQALTEIGEQKSANLSKVARIREDRNAFWKTLQPPLLEDLPLFPLLDARHGFRFPLYDYQRRLLNWMIGRERQSILFRAWPAEPLPFHDDTKGCLDARCIPTQLFCADNANSDIMTSNAKITNNSSLTSKGIEDKALTATKAMVLDRRLAHRPQDVLSVCSHLFAGSKHKNNAVLLEADESGSDDELFCDADETQPCAFGSCERMCRRRLALLDCFNIADGAEMANWRLMLEARCRNAAAKDMESSYQNSFRTQARHIGANPLLWRAGVSCGRTGCGKTTMKIALIYTMKLWEDQQPESERERLLSGSDATEYEALLATHRRPLKLQASEFTDDLVAMRKKLYYANCTMVVCPQQVVEQWFMEFIKTIGNGKARERPKTGKRRGVLNGGVFGEIVDEQDRVLLRVAVVRDIYGLRLISLQDVIERLDVLIVHQNVFKSPSYCRRAKAPLEVGLVKHLHPKYQNCDLFFSRDSTQWIAEAVKYERITISRKERELQNKMMVDGATDFDFGSVPKPGFSLGLPLLHAIHFRRVIIDEAHLLSQHVTVVERAVAALSADFVWCVTATANFDVRGAMFRYVNKYEGGYGTLLGIPNTNDRQHLESLMQYRQTFVQQCSATTSFEALPPLRLHYVPVSMTAAEAAIYSSLRSGVQSRLRRLLYCSHHMLNNAQWVEENIAKHVSTAQKDSNSAGAEALNELLTVDQVAVAMQKKRLEQIAHFNCEILLVMQTFRQKWCDLRDATTEALLTAAQESVDSGRAFVDDEQRQLQITDFVASNNDDDDEKEEEGDDDSPKQAPVLTADYLGDVDEEMLDAWRSERDVLIAMEVTRYDEELVRRGISLRAQYTHAKKNLEETVRARARVVSEYNFFQNTFDRLSRPDEEIECPVCLCDDETKDSVVLTQCGHEFCPPCAANIFKRGTARCAVCRKQLRIPRDLRLIDRRIEEEKVDSKKDAAAATVASSKDVSAAAQSGVRDLYGSKIDALIRLIRRILSRRDCKKIVIFAQFQHLLKLIADVLQKNGVEFVIAHGSIRSTERAFRAFRLDEDVRVILLSSEKSISGVHLVEANHLIAVHPTLCARGVEDEYAVLWQAIGRIRRLMQKETCHVWQMVMQNTIEEELYTAQTAVARTQQSMDVGIVWNAPENEDEAQQQELNQIEKAKDERRKLARLEIIQLLNKRAPSASKAKTVSTTDDVDDDDDDDDDDGDVVAAEPLPSSDDDLPKNAVEEDMTNWLTSRK